LPFIYIFDFKNRVVPPYKIFIFYLICLVAVSLLNIALQDKFFQAVYEAIEIYPVMLLCPGFIGERIRGRPPLTTLAWDEKFIAPYLSCFGPETSKASPPLRQLGAIFFKQLMR
jgi:hypothetical protein